ncbi:flagellar basal body-associated FliL family protein [Lentisphaerota bacterium WC36G]|nr:flagellar basal body-associated FliL family protein [Lentisphaerae bacterium WC36]
MADNNNELNEAQEITKGGNNDYFKFVITVIILAVSLLIATPLLALLAFQYMNPKTEQGVEDSSKFEKDIGKIDLGETRFNIAGTHGERYCQVYIVLHISQANDTKLYFEPLSTDNKVGMKSIFQAELLEILSTKTLSQLEKKPPLADQIKKRINTLLTEKKAPGIVDKVLFTKFIIQ